MKKLSLITASLVLFAGISFAQQTGTPQQATPTGKSAKTKGTGTTTGTAATVKKVPNSKTTKPVPTTTQPAASGSAK